MAEDNDNQEFVNDMTEPEQGLDHEADLLGDFEDLGVEFGDESEDEFDEEYIEEETDEKEKEKKESKFTGKFIGNILQRIDESSDKKIYVVMGVMMALIITLLAVALMLPRFLGPAGGISLEEGNHYITIPVDALNNANYIYVSEDIMLEDKWVKLKRILIDTVSTSFYFDGYFDVSGIEAILTDGDGNIYKRDISYVGETSGSLYDKPAELRFEPLKTDTRVFTLTITDPSASEDIQVKFVTDIPVVMPSARYITEPMDIMTSAEGISAKISNAVFAPTETVVNYIIKWDKGNVRLRHGYGDAPARIVLNDNKRYVMGTQSKPIQYEFDNCVIGSMKYQPVVSFASGAEFVFQNLYKEFDLGLELKAEPFFLNKEGTQQTITLGDYSLALERMGHIGNYYVLVLHGLESVKDVGNAEEISGSGKPTAKANDKANDEETGEIHIEKRVDTQVAVEMVVTKEDGTEIVVPGVCKHAKIGTDVLFDISEVRNEVVELPFSNFTLRLNSVVFRLEDAIIPIKLNIEADKNSERQELAVRAATDLIKKKTADSNAQMISYAISDGYMYAIVKEAWTENTRKLSARKHRVTLRDGNGGWQLVSDEIFEDTYE